MASKYFNFPVKQSSIGPVSIWQASSQFSLSHRKSCFWRKSERQFEISPAFTNFSHSGEEEPELSNLCQYHLRNFPPGMRPDIFHLISPPRLNRKRRNSSRQICSSSTVTKCLERWRHDVAMQEGPYCADCESRPNIRHWLQLLTSICRLLRAAA